MCFPVKIAKLLRTPLLQNTLVAASEAKLVFSRESRTNSDKFILFYLFIIYLGSLIVQMVLHPKLKK